MFRRQTSGSVVCASCGYLVGVNDARCYHCGRRNPGLWGFAPAVRRLGQDMGFVPFVTGTCVAVYVLTLIASGPDALGGGGLFSFLGPNQHALELYGASGVYPVVLYGKWWTVLSAGWLHAGLLHIGFNLLWIRQLAPAVAEMYGPGRMVVVYTVASALGFTASSLAVYVAPYVPGILRPGAYTVGASAAIFGLLGALVYYGRRAGASAVRGQAMSWALMMFIFGLLMPGVDNYAHGGGFAGGYLAGALLDPLKPERINHLVLALVCLALSIGAVAVSVLFGLFGR
jgi:rhomboid protease GluP